MRATRALPVLAFAAALVGGAGAADAQDVRDYFKQSCTSCHTIGGGPLTGPDLKDVTRRQDREWLVRFIQNPQAVFDSGDPYALEILQQARGVPMPALGVTAEQARQLLDLIEAESALPQSAFAGAQVSDRPLTAADIAQGRALFLGLQPLANGGPACIGCHASAGLGGLGGGQLGPDLTEAYARLEGRKALSAWLSAPATPTMAVAFREHPLHADEVLPLVAFLKSETERREPPDAAATLNLLMLGLAGVSGLLVLFDLLWKRRFRAVRRPLVGGRP